MGWKAQGKQALGGRKKLRQGKAWHEEWPGHRGQAELGSTGKMPIVFNALLPALLPPSKEGGKMEKKWRREKARALLLEAAHRQREHSPSPRSHTLLTEEEIHRAQQFFPPWLGLAWSMLGNVDPSKFCPPVSGS